MTYYNANAFALPFAFAPHTGKRCKSKRECKPTHQDSATIDKLHFDTERRAAGNKVLPQWGLTNFYGATVHKRTFVSLINSGADNPPLRQYPNRCLQL